MDYLCEEEKEKKAIQARREGWEERIANGDTETPFAPAIGVSRSRLKSQSGSRDLLARPERLAAGGDRLCVPFAVGMMLYRAVFRSHRCGRAGSSLRTPRVPAGVPCASLHGPEAPRDGRRAKDKVEGQAGGACFEGDDSRTTGSVRRQPLLQDPADFTLQPSTLAAAGRRRYRAMLPKSLLHAAPASSVVPRPRCGKSDRVKKRPSKGDRGGTATLAQASVSGKHASKKRADSDDREVQGCAGPCPLALLLD